MRWLLGGFFGIVLLVGAQQIRKIDDKVLKSAGKGTEWTMNGMDWGEQRYSTMTQINPGNVKNLKVAFTFSTGVNRGQESSPIVVGSIMYVLTPFPNILYALDLTRDGAPTLWTYEPQPDSASQGVAC